MIKHNNEAASAPTKRPSRPTDCTTHYTPTQVAGRWGWHPESVRRKLRLREIASVIIGRRRLVSLAEIERVELEGTVNRTA